MNPDPELRFYSPYAPTLVGHNRLPTWDQQHATYMLTFRLADSLPAPLWRQMVIDESEWRALHPAPWSPSEEAEYMRRFVGVAAHWLDRGLGECHLRRPELAGIVRQALHYFEGERTRLHAWVIMPNHVHVVTELLDDQTLPKLMESWKGFTAREINRRLGRQGTFWQKGYHDRLLRNWEHFAHSVRYIRRNPAKARLPEGHWMAGESELAQRF